MIILLFIQSILLSFNSDPTGKSDSNIFFIKNNPAIINNDLIFGVKPNIFGIEELNDIYFSGNINLKNFNFNGIIFTNNNELKRDLIISFNSIYKYKLFNLGIRINYNNILIENYFNENIFNLDIGGIYYFNDKISIGGYFNNINLSENNFINNNNYFTSAISYKYDLIAFYLGVDVLFNIDYGINSGINLKLNDYLSFRINYSTIIKSINSTLNINYKNLNINLFISRHNELGFSQEYQVIYDY